MFAFLGVAFAFSWSLALALYLAQPGPLGRVALMALFMFGPAVGAVVAQRLRKEPVLHGLGALPFKPNRWFLVAWLAPFALAFVTILVSLAFPGVEPAVSGAALVDRILSSAPAPAGADVAAARAELSAIPPAALLLLMVAQALIAGISINAVAAFGEELGWRGFMHMRLRERLPFWRRSLVIGAVWGVWHAPLILQGHNYPAHPVIGVLMMTVFCVLLAPLFEWMRERSGSVLAVSIMHGTINASAGFAVLLVKGGNDLIVGVTGAAGFIVLACVNLALLMYRARRHG